MHRMCLTDRIKSMVRSEPIPIRRIAEMHYAGLRRVPNDPVNAVRGTCANLRKQGFPVCILHGYVFLNRSRDAFVRPVISQARYDNEPLSARECQIVRVLREYHGIPLSAEDLADEIPFTRYGQPMNRSNVVAAIKRIVAKGIAIERVGLNYRLSEKRP